MNELEQTVFTLNLLKSNTRSNLLKQIFYFNEINHICMHTLSMHLLLKAVLKHANVIIKHEYRCCDEWRNVDGLKC